MGAHLEYHGCGRPHDRPIFGGKLGVVRRGGGCAHPDRASVHPGEEMRRVGGCAPLRNGSCLRAGSAAQRYRHERIP